MPESVRSFFESRFGYDFSKVSVHTNSGAAESARAVNAQAFVVGREIVFGPGRYTTETAAGKKLLAHELAHVVQQGAARESQTHGGLSNPSIGRAYAVSSFPSIVQRKVGFDDCDREGGTKEKDAITAAHNRAIERISIAVRQLSSNPESIIPFRQQFRWLGLFAPEDPRKEEEKIREAIRVYEKALVGLRAENFSYECDYKEDWNLRCEEDVEGWAMPGILAPLYDIHLCWGFFNQAVEEQADIIVHEAVHKWANVSHGPDPLDNAYNYGGFFRRLAEFDMLR
ncbi:MAG: DUF4157 domain-containing protein [Dehalococcoidia bacterium]